MAKKRHGGLLTMTEDELDDVVVDDMISHAKLAKKVAHLKEITEDHSRMIGNADSHRDYVSALADAFGDLCNAIGKL